MHVHHLNFDFQVAYDTVCRKEMWSEMHKLGVPGKLVRLCRIWNNEIFAKVKIRKDLFSELKVNKGLWQGDVDDLVVMGRRLQGVGQMFVALVEQTNRMGIEIN